MSKGPVGSVDPAGRWGFAACGLAAAIFSACSGGGGKADGEDATDVPGEDPAPDEDADAVDGEPDSGDVADAADAVEDEAGDAADAGDAEEDGGGVYKRATLTVTPGWAPEGSIAMLCWCEGDLPPPDVLAEAGGCRLEHDESGGVDLSVCRALDYGEIRLEHGTDTYVLGPSTFVPFACAFSFGSGMPAFPSGDDVRIHSTGGSELPAFDVTLTVPPRVTLTAPAEGATLVPGDPWETRWTPATDVHAVFVLAGIHLVLRCGGTGVPPLAASPSVTALWDEHPWSDLLNFRVTSEQVIPGDPEMTIEIGTSPATPEVNIATP